MNDPILNDLHAFMDSNIGQVNGDIKVKQLRNTDGTLYWKATTRVTHIFGSEIEGGECEGIGTTKEQAIERLQKSLRDFNDSLWV